MPLFTVRAEARLKKLDRFTMRVGLPLSLALLLAGRPLGAQDATELGREVPKVTTVVVDYSRVGFQESLDPWQYASASIGQRTGAGSLIGRLNFAHRFGSSGTQVEVDAYPHLTSNIYAYASIGYSASSIFPSWRSGGELFTSLPSAWEASLGYRQLRFGGAPVTLFTAAVGKYVSNYWFSLRPYVRATTNGPSASASLTSRRYYADGDHFIGARVGYGSTPPDQAPDSASLSRTHSFSASVQGSGDLIGRVLGTWSAGYEREELTFTTLRRSWTVSTGLRVPF